MELKHVKFSLIAILLIKAYEILVVAWAMSQISGFDLASIGLSYAQIIPLSQILVIAGALFCIKELKENSLIGWLGSLLIAIISLPTLAFPFSLITGYVLLQKNQRSRHLAELKEKFA